MMNKLRYYLTPPFLLLILLTLTACGGESETTESLAQTDSQLRTLIITKSMVGDPITPSNTPTINSKTAQLGMRLFYSKSLGGNRDSACATCHHPLLGGGDALSLPIGTEAQNPDLLGPGRLHATSGTHFDGGPTTPRNAPTTFNLVGWDSVLFHDGRLESLAKTPHANGTGTAGIRTPDSAFGVADPNADSNLAQAQARFPITSPAEMKGFNHPNKDRQQMRNYLAGTLGGYSGEGNLLAGYWLEKFREAYNAPYATAETLITEKNIAFLIGEYERSQVFINTPWKAYVEGDSTAISASAKKGALLFFNTTAKGGADCSSCHRGDFFTDELFHNLAMPQMGRGKKDGEGSEDFGRFRVTGKHTDKYAFRTPSLINTEVTGPWTHAGAYTSLSAVIKHHLNPQQAIDNYDGSQLAQAGIQNLASMPTNTQKALDAINFKGLNLDFTDEQVNDLVAFIKSLTDPCVKDPQCLAPWILDDSDTDADPNGDQINYSLFL